jgi:uncharacterized protein YbjT (DUF2867 family)
MPEALEGVQGLFLLAGLRYTPELLRLALDQGADRVVLLSSAATENSANDDALTAYHRRSEDTARESGLGWTLLRPQAFSSNVLRWTDELRLGDDLRIPFPDLRIACIDPRDLGEVAATALLGREHEGEALRLPGPEPLLPEEQLVVVGEVTGRTLNGIPLDDAATREHLLRTTPPAIVEALFALYRGGGLDESFVTNAVPRILGRPAGTFRSWAVRERASLAW